MKYKVVYADPPWAERGGGKIKRGADRHYPLMKTKDIMALPVNEITDDNCHLYLWVTNNFLKDGLDVMEAWGFRYVTMVTWAKDKMGLGQYFRGMTEHCLFGVKGRLPYKTNPDTGKRCQGKTLLIAPRRKHSAKPKQMREMIELVSHEPRIELFSRSNADGWDHLGNAQDGKDIKDQLAAMVNGDDVTVAGNGNNRTPGNIANKNTATDLFE